MPLLPSQKLSRIAAKHGIYRKMGAQKNFFSCGFQFFRRRSFCGEYREVSKLPVPQLFILISIVALPLLFDQSLTSVI
jgi:hypothetical protein